MKLVLFPEEVKQILLTVINQQFSTNFNSVEFRASYSALQDVTLEEEVFPAKPENDEVLT